MSVERHPVEAARLERGLTRDELADRAGVALGTIERLETGLTRNPQERVLNAVADALEMRPNLLERQIVVWRGRVTA